MKELELPTPSTPYAIHSRAPLLLILRLVEGKWRKTKENEGEGSCLVHTLYPLLISTHLSLLVGGEGVKGEKGVERDERFAFLPLLMGGGRMEEEEEKDQG